MPANFTFAKTKVKKKIVILVRISSSNTHNAYSYCKTKYVESGLEIV